MKKLKFKKNFLLRDHAPISAGQELEINDSTAAFCIERGDAVEIKSKTTKKVKK